MVSFFFKRLNAVWELILITIGTAIVAAAVFFFLVPSHLSIGSVSGLSIVLANLIPLPVSVIMMIINILFLLLGFLLIGKEFGAKTVYTSLLLPVFTWLFEIFLADYQVVMNDQLSNLFCYCFFVCIGQTLLFLSNASSGGLDVAAKILNKYFHMELGQALSLSGICVALSAALVYDAQTVILSILGTYLGGVFLDHFIFSFNAKKRICILSEQNDKIQDFILHKLNRGATLYNAFGPYQSQTRREIVTIVDKNDYSKLIRFIHEIDPNAFVTVYTVNEVLSRPRYPAASPKK